MGLIQELGELLTKFRPWETVNEFENGLLRRCGVVVERRVSWPKKNPDGEDLEKIVARERKALLEAGGEKAFRPFRRPLPQLSLGYRRHWFNGYPRDPKRYEKSKNLKAGAYIVIPAIFSIHDMYTGSIQEKVEKTENHKVLTSDPGSTLLINFNLVVRYKIIDFYKNYMAIHDYETSLAEYSAGLFSKMCRGRYSLDQWRDPKIVDDLEEKVMKEIEKIVKTKWGVDILAMYVQDIGPVTMQSVTYEGPPLNIPNPVHVPNGSIV